jgi:hypothetical protein
MENFWIETEIDGRKTPLRGGPRGKHGGFFQTIYIKDRGESREVVTIHGHATGDGRLVLCVEEVGGEGLIRS